MKDKNITDLPVIIAGPIVRHVSPTQITIWVVSSEPLDYTFSLQAEEGEPLLDMALSGEQVITTQVGTNAFVTHLVIQSATSLPTDTKLNYDILVQNPRLEKTSICNLVEQLTYKNEQQPSFVIRTNIKQVLHGSCRKPHFPAGDGLCQVDMQIERGINDMEKRPDLLMMSGDQVYADDVAGPTLQAIHQTIKKLGLFQEDLDGSIVNNSEELFLHPYSFYQRSQLLPDTEANEGIYSKFFAAKKKPIFTSVNANNHLVSFSEVMAMYILTWSPEMWKFVTFDGSFLEPQFQPTFQQEQEIIEQFRDGLYKVRRALSHIPVYMIFDDHDITDDWNLTRGWEEAIYNNPFAKRIVGNALIGYWLCQGWGNAPHKFEPITKDIDKYFGENTLSLQDELIDRLLDWQSWHYCLDTHPKVVVLDTRTQRWRSESSLSKPSGLMDWEALCDLQQELINQPAVIMVSAAPIFGVKLIEIIQKIFTFFGKALTVDAENWMAHKGTASVMLNIFRHYKTPPNFVILSGDVHYSFVYDITLRFRRHSPRITQITSSGIKNEFPAKLLTLFDKLNRLFYAKRSPLNWFTQRRKMAIAHRRPSNLENRTLLNCSGIGQLKIDAQCSNIEANLLSHTGEVIKFVPKNSEKD